jgi:hypothetical protein
MRRHAIAGGRNYFGCALGSYGDAPFQAALFVAAVLPQ